MMKYTVSLIIGLVLVQGAFSASNSTSELINRLESCEEFKPAYQKAVKSIHASLASSNKLTDSGDCGTSLSMWSVLNCISDFYNWLDGLSGSSSSSSTVTLSAKHVLSSSSGCSASLDMWSILDCISDLYNWIDGSSSTTLTSSKTASNARTHTLALLKTITECASQN